MTPGKASRRVILDRLDWIQRMLADLRKLPLYDEAAFFADWRNQAVAESSLRRALEALFDLGRHILAKAYGKGVSEYHEIARALTDLYVISNEEGRILGMMAGYRNRLVHFYHEVTPGELYQICATELDDLGTIITAIKRWLQEHPDQIDESL